MLLGTPSLPKNFFTESVLRFSFRLTSHLILWSSLKASEQDIVLYNSESTFAKIIILCVCVCIKLDPCIFLHNAEKSLQKLSPVAS